MGGCSFSIYNIAYRLQEFKSLMLKTYVALLHCRLVGILGRPSEVQQRESACGFFPLYGVRHILKTQSKAIYKPAYMSSACVFYCTADWK